MRAPNLALGLASLVLSVAFWIYVQSQRVETFDETVELPLQVYGLNPDYSILRTPKAKISVTANGTVADIIKFRAQLADAINSGKAPSLGLIAVLDLSAARPEDEETEYPVRLPRNDVTRQAGIRFKNSPDLPVVVVYRSRRRIPIQIETENIPEGFGVSMATLEPKDMFVGGPKRDLERVDHASGRVNLGDYKPGRTYPVTLKAVDKDGLEIKTVSLEATSVIYTPILSIAAPEKSVLIDVVFKPGTRPAPGYRLKAFSTADPAVSVQGLTSVISGIKVVKTAPIDLSNLKATENRKVPLVNPEGTKLSSPDVKVELVIEKVAGIDGANP